MVSLSIRSENAFVYGDLEEEVYLEQPPRFVAHGETGEICGLRKALDGLKQFSRAWFGKLVMCYWIWHASLPI